MTVSRGTRLFVTGTDTGVGKTWVSCRLLEHWSPARRAGLKAAESGVQAGTTTDDEQLFVAAGSSQLERCAYQFEPAVAPGVAAEDQGTSIDPTRIAAQVEALADQEIVIVEGAGGWMVPLGAGNTIADLAKLLAMPVLIVARAGLGTINHSVLTHDAVVRTGLPCAAIVLNAQAGDDLDMAERNRREIERMVAAPVVLVVGQVAALATVLRP